MQQFHMMLLHTAAVVVVVISPNIIETVSNILYKGNFYVKTVRKLNIGHYRKIKGTISPVSNRHYIHV